MSKRVVVFLDWQNVYKGARESFHVEDSPSQCGQIRPIPLAEHIVSRIPDAKLKQVRIYRGLPSNEQDPKGYGAVRKHTAALRRADPTRTEVILKPLHYDDGGAPREKSVDVQLAVDFVMMAINDEYDIGVIFTTDTDLKPPLDAAFDLHGRAFPWPMTAGWDGPNHYKRCIAATGNRRAPCIWITMPTYMKVKDSTRYAK